MKLIKLTANDEITVHEFPSGTHEEQNKAINELIGDNCRIYEHILPKRLYSSLGMVSKPTKIRGQCVSMLADEEFLLKQTEGFNSIASYLYEVDVHGYPILGTVLFVGEEWSGDGIDFCGIEESVFENLLLKLKNMVTAMKATKEAIR